MGPGPLMLTCIPGLLCGGSLLRDEGWGRCRSGAAPLFPPFVLLLSFSFTLRHILFTL